MIPQALGQGFLQSIEQGRIGDIMRVADGFGSAPPVAQTLLDQAATQYPVLKDLGLQYKKSAGDTSGNLLEFWPPGEPGSPDRPRPKEFDLKRPGIEVYSDKVRPIDILGDVVSHHMIETDPQIQKVYNAFQQSITPKQEGLLQRQYEFAKAHDGEKRPFAEWRERAGVPAFFRGHAFDQWPAEFNQQVYTPQQLKLLDAMMSKLSGGK